MMKTGGKHDKEELFERTGALHRKLVPASDSLKEGYVLLGRHDLMPKIRKLILRATTLVFMKYKKDIVVKEIPLNSIQTVQIYSRNKACFVLKYRTRRRLKNLVIETRNAMDAAAWVELLKTTIAKVSSDINELLSSPLMTTSGRRHSDPPTPNFAQQQSNKNNQKPAAADDDDDDESSSESDEFDISTLAQTRGKILTGQGSISATSLPTVGAQTQPIPHIQSQQSAPVVNPFFANQQPLQQPPHPSSQFTSSQFSNASHSAPQIPPSSNFDPFGPSSSSTTSSTASFPSFLSSSAPSAQSTQQPSFTFPTTQPSTAPTQPQNDPFNLPVIPHLAQQNPPAVPPSYVPPQQTTISPPSSQPVFSIQNQPTAIQYQQQQQPTAPQVPPSFVPSQQNTAPQIPPSYVPPQQATVSPPASQPVFSVQNQPTAVQYQPTAPQVPPSFVAPQQQKPVSQAPQFSFSTLMTVPEGLRIVKEHGFISATVLGALTTPNELDEKVEGMKEQVQKKLMTAVAARGGNAVLGMGFNISFQPTGSFVMCAFGSACALA
eukprot:TRINITY_DN5525_c0_g2_i1.p1 TRINITY_DN5525_c0_g2~~TRINITY_DN5525_c0_g2_i1.p1  ORF type:complete len:548 (-),score=179.38 TRINITY_DN5525_c0_g2_i1:26-1669(-)